MRIISFYSFKGGVGRTTALVNAAFELARRKYRVLVIDGDVEAPSLDVRLTDGALQDGLVELASAWATEGALPPDALGAVRAVRQWPGRLWMIGAGREDADYPARQASLDWPCLHPGVGTRGFLDALRALIQGACAPDYVLVDARTGFAEISGVLTHHLADQVVLVTSLSEDAVIGTARAAASLAHAGRSLRLVVSMLPAGDDPRIAHHLDRLTTAIGEASLSAPVVRVSYDPSLAFGDVIAVDDPVIWPIAHRYEELVDQLLVSDPDAGFSVTAEAWALRDQGRIQEAEDVLTRAMADRPGAPGLRRALGDLLLSVNRPADAVGAYAQALKLAPTHGTLHHAHGRALRRKGDLEAAAEALLRAEQLGEASAELFQDLAEAHTGEPSQRYAARARELRLDRRRGRADVDWQRYTARPRERYLDRTLGQPDGDSIRRLREGLLEETRRLTPFLSGLEARELPDVFVPLRAVVGSGPRTLRALLSEAHPLSEVDSSLRGRTKDHGAARVVIIAEPGAGKTTVVRQLVHELAGENGPLGVYIPLYALARHKGDLAGWLEEAHGLPDLGARLREEAAAGRLWLLLDGLDEVEPASLSGIRKRLEALAADPAWARVPMVVTGRPVAFETHPLAGWHEARLEHLRPAQQDELMNRLVGAQAPEVLSAVRARPMLASLIHNPLLLTLVAYTAKVALDDGRGLPVSRVAVYREAVTLLLEARFSERRRTERRVRDVLSAQEALQRLAYRLMDLPGETWPKEQLTRLLVDEMRQDEELGGAVKYLWGTPDALLEDIWENSGLLGRHDGPLGDWRFLHRSLREYLAAREVVRRGDIGLERARQDSAERWGETWGLAIAMLADPATHLRELAKVSREVVLRAVQSIDGLPPALVVELVWDNPTWTSEELAAALRLCSGTLTNMEAAVLDRVTPQATADQLGRAWSTLEELRPNRGPWDVVVDRADFFRRCGKVLPAELPPMVFIPAGRFRMGSPDRIGQKEEHPAHSVTLTRSYQIGKTPVTNAEYRRLWPRHQGDHDDHPLHKVTWYEARLFAAWLGGRLPTEAEWEHAARAGKKTPFFFGKHGGDLQQYAWFSDEKKIAEYNMDKRGLTGLPELGNAHDKLHPVGQLAASPWGLHDVYGLVWEWCADSQRPFATCNETDPVGANDRRRVCRGGDYTSPAAWCRSARRNSCSPGERYQGVGLRVLLPGHHSS